MARTSDVDAPLCGSQMNIFSFQSDFLVFWFLSYSV